MPPVMFGILLIRVHQKAFVVNVLEWRQNEHDGVSNHQRLDCLLNCLFLSRTDKKHQSSASLAFVRGIRRWPVNSPHKGPVKRIFFRFDDAITGCNLALRWFPWKYAIDR